jgi:hypothetical protein
MMTEAELIEAATSFSGLMQGWVSIYFTALTAFLVTTYLAGSKLSTNQAIFVCGGFFIITSLCTFAAFATGNQLVHLSNEVESINPNRKFAANYPIIYVLATVLGAGCLGGLKFMWDVRHPKTE